jgi:hypothetical protein
MEPLVDPRRDPHRSPAPQPIDRLDRLVALATGLVELPAEVAGGRRQDGPLGGGPAGFVGDRGRPRLARS